MENDNECSICRNECIQPTSFPCNHTVCVDCYSIIVGLRQPCPFCRQASTLSEHFDDDSEPFLKDFLQICGVSDENVEKLIQREGIKTVEDFLRIDDNHLIRLGIPTRRLLSIQEAKRIFGRSSNVAAVLAPASSRGAANLSIGTEAALRLASEIAESSTFSVARASQIVALRSLGSVATWVGPAICFTIDIGCNWWLLRSKQITGKQFIKNLTAAAVSNVVSIGGGIGGAVAGGAVGTLILPGLGTIIGAAIGGFLGSLITFLVARYATKKSLDLVDVLKDTTDEKIQLETERRYVKCLSILGVQKNSPEREVKRQRNSLALKYHPDRAGNVQKTKEIFIEIMTAYEIVKAFRTAEGTWQ